MLMALLLVSLLGGGSAELFTQDDFQAADRVIEDESRLVVATRIMTRINSRYGAIFDQRRAAAGQLATLDGDMYAPEDAYAAVLEQLWQQREHATDGYIRDVFELRQHVTREEWAAIFDAPVE